MGEYTEYLKEIFEWFGTVSVRRMFGAYGLYHNDLMFGLFSGESLYLKTDQENVRFFQELGLEPFEYRRKGKVVRLSFHLAPEEILDDRELAAVWARRSYEAAVRSVGKAGVEENP
jgi:DNA transformation protein